MLVLFHGHDWDFVLSMAIIIRLWIVAHTYLEVFTEIGYTDRKSYGQSRYKAFAKPGWASLTQGK